MTTPILKNLTEAINYIKTLGFTTDLTVDQNCLYCSAEDDLFSPDQFTVQMHLQFPSELNPNIPVHLLALASNHHNLRGFRCIENAN
jgi:hypothetical protein